VEGLPRVDPQKILAAGITLRRLAGGVRQGWMSAGGRILGWRGLPGNAIGQAPLWDPDTTVRRERELGANRAVLVRSTAIVPAAATWEEAHAPLFVAPPEVCKAAGRTLLYGYLPLTSDERSEDDPAPVAPFDDELLLARLPVVLWRAGRREEMPLAEQPSAPMANASANPAIITDPAASLQVVIDAASYLAQEPGLFTPPTSGADPTATLRSLLLARQVEVFGLEATRSLYRVLEDAYDLFVRRAGSTSAARSPVETVLRLPVEWPEFTAAEEAAFVAAIRPAVEARWAALSPGETRFQNREDRYEIRAFARIDRSDCGCPPETIWTAPSLPVEIVPWYEGGVAPPTVVELPAPNADFFGKLKPNIAFKVPEEIQQFMSGLKLDDLVDGKKPGSRLGFGMICGFSIPIITICAFIVLQIFLVLFQILFWWLPFIRICIPFPKRSG
jgi:hypothetical protein